VSLYRAQGHLLEVTDLVEKLQQKAGGFFPVSMSAVMYKGKAYGIPQSVSPWPLVTRMDILEAAKVDPPKTWDEFIEVCKKLQKPPKLTGFGMCLGLYTDADNNIMNMIWNYGGKLIEADDKTIALNSPGTVQAVKVIADMYLKHKIIPKGAISWDNQGNNKAYQSRQVIFALNPSSIYAHLAESDKELYDVTGMQLSPAGPGGAAIEELTTAEWMLFGRVLHGPGKSTNRHGGRRGTLGTALSRDVQQCLLEGPEFPALARHAGAGTPIRLSGHDVCGVWRGPHYQRPRSYDASRVGGRLGSREGRRRGAQ
jgi:hypothetical protein